MHSIQLNAPGQQGMERLMASDGVMIKQLNSECCRFFCLQPNIHFTMHPYNTAAGVSFDTVGPVRCPEDDTVHCVSSAQHMRL